MNMRAQAPHSAKFLKAIWNEHSREAAICRLRSPKYLVFTRVIASPHHALTAAAIAPNRVSLPPAPSSLLSKRSHPPTPVVLSLQSTRACGNGCAAWRLPMTMRIRATAMAMALPTTRPAPSATPPLSFSDQTPRRSPCRSACRCAQPRDSYAVHEGRGAHITNRR
eukprot:2025699-Pleurochrysis_carterae.AAC.2